MANEHKAGARRQRDGRRKQTRAAESDRQSLTVERPPARAHAAQASRFLHHLLLCSHPAPRRSRLDASTIQQARASYTDAAGKLLSVSLHRRGEQRQGSRRGGFERVLECVSPPPSTFEHGERRGERRVTADDISHTRSCYIFPRCQPFVAALAASHTLKLLNIGSQLMRLLHCRGLRARALYSCLLRGGTRAKGPELDAKGR